MRRRMDVFAAACDNFGLIINTEKTVVMHQPTPDAAYIAPQINLNGIQLQVVEKLTYLGRSLFRTTKVDDEVARCTSKASQVFGCLQSAVWFPHQHQTEEVQGGHPVDAAAVTWTLYKKQARRLIHFQLGCLRRILKLRWQDMISGTDVLERTGILSVYVTLKQLQLRSSGHLVGWTTSGYPNDTSIEMSSRDPADKESKSVDTRTL
ncbi:hypothetical protein SprV_0100152900 [Sparganum proliferum]